MVRQKTQKQKRVSEDLKDPVLAAAIQEQMPARLERIIQSLMRDVNQMTIRERLDFMGKLMPYVLTRADESRVLKSGGFEQIEQLTVSYLKRIGQISQ